MPKGVGYGGKKKPASKTSQMKRTSRPRMGSKRSK